MIHSSVCTTAALSASCAGGNPLDVARKMFAALKETLLEGMEGPFPIQEKQLRTQTLSSINRIRMEVRVFEGEMAQVIVELKNATNDVIKEIIETVILAK
ncbi:MAG: hypothetical protein UW95_C0013G0006 [Parcubacteria group bacterium GW2011_GWC1_45_14]|nr:MAG: hypothetical protein UW95_C0013G0006 [Parcubacteria group bacterium GW2011_GWC1_45_14]